MIFNPLLVFKLILMTSLFIAMSSNSTIMMWVSLELNMLSFLPIMTSSEYSPMENSMKYFLIQSMASIIYIICVLICLMKYNFILETFMITSMMIKLGAAPFHGWFLSLSKSVSLFVLLLISTVQKIIPTLIVSSLNLFNNMVMFVCVITFFVIFYNSMMLLSLMKILALSGMNNLVWFLVSMMTGIQFFFFFFFIYYWLFMGIFIMFLYPMKSVSNQMFSSGHYNKLMKIFTLLSLGGLPPFLGFLGKLYILKVSMLMINSWFLFLLVMSSLVVLFMYMSFSFMVLSYPIKTGFDESETKNKMLKKFYMLSIFLWPFLFL